MDIKGVLDTECCVCCGRPVPEGRLVCPVCEAGEIAQSAAQRNAGKNMEGGRVDMARKCLRIGKTVLVWLVVAAAVLMMIFTIVSVTTLNRNDRTLFGYKMFIVNTDSMAKTDFDAGDLIFVKEVDPSTLKEGDIITFLSQNTTSFGKTLSHKIRAVTTDASGNPGFITYGTTTDTDDETVVTYHYIMGQYQFSIPKLGTFFNFLKTTPGYFLCIFLPFMLLILYQGVHFFVLFRRYKREQMEELQREREKLETERQESIKMLEQIEQLKAQLAESRTVLPPTDDAPEENKREI